MPITLGLNIAALNAQRQLERKDSEVSKTFERLSSGLRINRASDDAAGLAISESLRADSRVYTQAIRNVNDGISALAIQDAALEQLTVILTRQKELAIQAANGTFTFEQRKSLHKEADALTDEYNRIVESVEFNGRKLLENPNTELRIQAGYGVEGSIGFQLAGELSRNVGDGTYDIDSSVTSAADNSGTVLADLNGDGKLDIINLPTTTTGSVHLGNGDGTFNAKQDFTSGTVSAGSFVDAVVADFNGDGVLDLALPEGGSSSVSLFVGNGDGTFKARTSFSAASNVRGMEVGDFNNDGKLDLLAAGPNSFLYLGNGDGTFHGNDIGIAGFDASVADVDRDGNLDYITSASGQVKIARGNGDGTFSAPTTITLSGDAATGTAVLDLNRDGYADIVTADFNLGSGDAVSVFMNNGDGTFGPRITYATVDRPNSLTVGDMNGDGYDDLLVGGLLAPNTMQVLISNKDGTLTAGDPISAAAGSLNPAIGDVNGDGANDIVQSYIGSSTVNVHLANTTRSSHMEYFELYTAAEALDSLATIDSALERVGRERGAIGSTQSRLEVTLKTLSVARENFDAAASRIRDADIAEESANLTRTQILRSAALSVLAQANQSPALALQLLS